MAAEAVPADKLDAFEAVPPSSLGRARFKAPDA